MPRRTDLNHVLVIGSGPIVIGQACEFDYSGTQACRVLRSEGLTVSLVNSNPATIMTDPEYADFTYVEPITPEFVEKVLAQQAERGNPIDAVLATLGGQTALNTAVALSENGALDRYGVELIGAPLAGQSVHLLPMMGSVLAVVFLGEAFELFHAAGIVLIMGGITLASWRGRR